MIQKPLSQKLMHQKLRQVALTYLTLPAAWLIVGFLVLMTGGAHLAVHNGARTTLWAACGLGFPIYMGLLLVIGIAKQQFANPRSQLLPNFAHPHLTVLVTLFLFILVANPLCFSLIDGLSTPGCMAYSLLLGGLATWGNRPGGNWLTLPGMAIFFSGIAERGAQFWFVSPNRFDTLHSILALTGATMVVAWLWHLPQLTEERDDYQVIPMGRPGAASRMERVEQRKIMGTIMNRRGLMRTLADRWHDRLDQLPTGPESHSQLMQYGFGRISGITRALMIGLAFTLYGIFLYLVFFPGDYKAGPASGMILAVQCMLLAPAIAAGRMMMQRLPRMSQELLRPATRTEFIDSLFLSLAKQSIWIWLVVHLGVSVIAFSTVTLTAEHLLSLAFSYTLVSLAVQLPTFGFSLWIVRKISVWRFLLGFYAAMIFQLAVIGGWWLGRKQLGDLTITSILLVALLALGAKSIAWARNAWQQTELA